MIKVITGMRRVGKSYFLKQIIQLLLQQEVVEREFTPLQQVKDNYPKYVLSMDTLPGSDYEGIRRMNIMDFLLSDEKTLRAE